MEGWHVGGYREYAELKKHIGLLRAVPEYTPLPSIVFTRPSAGCASLLFASLTRDCEYAFSWYRT